MKEDSLEICLKFTDCPMLTSDVKRPFCTVFLNQNRTFCGVESFYGVLVLYTFPNPCKRERRLFGNILKFKFKHGLMLMGDVKMT